MLQSLIDVILPVFLVIGAGYTATRTGYFKEAHVDGLMKFTQGFAIPCLLFLAIAHLDLSASFDPRLLASFYSAARVVFHCRSVRCAHHFRARLGRLCRYRVLLPVLKLCPLGSADN